MTAQPPPRRYTVDDPLTVALAGFGNVGRDLARRLVAGIIPEVRLTAISARDLEKARTGALDLNAQLAVVPVAELPEHAEVIVECATGEALPAIAEAALSAGRTLIPVSVGALAAHPEILDLAAQHGGRIRIATGALPGLDAVRIAAEGGIESLTLTSRIRPESLAGEAYVLGRGFDLSTPPAEAVEVFDGTALEAAGAFPRHFNVATALALAGIGFDRTRIVVFADPAVAGTVHNVEVRGRDVELSLTSRNLPSPENPHTSRAVAPSVMAALRALIAPVHVGS